MPSRQRHVSPVTIRENNVDVLSPTDINLTWSRRRRSTSPTSPNFSTPESRNLRRRSKSPTSPTLDVQFSIPPRRRRRSKSPTTNTPAERRTSLIEQKRSKSPNTTENLMPASREEILNRSEEQMSILTKRAERNRSNSPAESSEGHKTTFLICNKERRRSKSPTEPTTTEDESQMIYRRERRRSKSPNNVTSEHQISALAQRLGRQTSEDGEPAEGRKSSLTNIIERKKSFERPVNERLETKPVVTEARAERTTEIIPTHGEKSREGETNLTTPVIPERKLSTAENRASRRAMRAQRAALRTMEPEPEVERLGMESSKNAGVSELKEEQLEKQEKEEKGRKAPEKKEFEIDRNTFEDIKEEQKANERSLTEGEDDKELSNRLVRGSAIAAWEGCNTPGGNVSVRERIKSWVREPTSSPKYGSPVCLINFHA